MPTRPDAPRDFSVQRENARFAIANAQFASTLKPFMLVAALFDRSARDELQKSAMTGPLDGLVREIGGIYGFEDVSVSLHEIETALHFATKGIHLLGQSPWLHIPLIGNVINAASLQVTGTMAIAYFELKLCSDEPPSPAQIWDRSLGIVSRTH